MRQCPVQQCISRNCSLPSSSTSLTRAEPPRLEQTRLPSCPRATIRTLSGLVPEVVLPLLLARRQGRAEERQKRVTLLGRVLLLNSCASFLSIVGLPFV